MADRGHSGAAYELCRRYVLEHYDACCRCGLAVDKTLSGRHRWGPSLDLVVPYSRGGQMVIGNSALAHLRCNAGYRDGRRLRAPAVLRLPQRGRYVPSGSC